MLRPIIEAYADHRQRCSGQPRLMLICRSPEHGAILRKRQVVPGDSVHVAGEVARFTLEMLDWYRPQRQLVSRCAAVLL